MEGFRKNTNGEGYSLPTLNGLTKSASHADLAELGQLSQSLAAMLSRQMDQPGRQKQTPEAIQEAISISHALQSSDCETVGPSQLPAKSYPASRARVPPRPIAKSSQRRGVCTHVTLDRVWGSPFTCSHCRKLSPLGWSYECTQDHGEDALPYFTLESLNIQNPHEVEAYFQRLEDKSTQLGQLSPWIMKAIRDGHYTDDQICLLELQKQGVNDVIFEAAESAYQDGDPTRYFPSRSPPPQRSLTGILGRKATPSALPSYGEYMLRLVPNRSQRCVYRTCQSCRPISKDRAWACIDHAFETKNVPEVNFEFDFRPISDVNIVRNLGLRTPPKPLNTKPLPPLPSSPREDVTDVRKVSCGSVPLDAEKSIICRQSGESGGSQSQMREDGGSIRKSLRRTLKGFWDGRRSWIPTKSFSRAEGTVGVSDGRPKTKDSEISSTKSEASGDLGHRDRGSNVPLPDEDGKDAFEDELVEEKLNEEGEVIVDDGIAVTEEAIFFHETDIITSV